MIIMRSGCGVHLELELTAEELRQAYLEQQHLYDLEDIKRELDGACERYAEKFGIDVETVTPEEIEQMANIFRRCMDDVWIIVLRLIGRPASQKQSRKY